MKIKELFLKPIDRPINGVIKADQMDEASVWQELEEYVVTKQISDYLGKFFNAYLAAIDSPKDAAITDRMGVWVSGFFGSGKSHFIKILSYLLENLEAHNPLTGEKRRANQFFDKQRIKDLMLMGDIQRATKGTADVILFNIDAKADSKGDRDAILQVFLRVFLRVFLCICRWRAMCRLDAGLRGFLCGLWPVAFAPPSPSTATATALKCVCVCGRVRRSGLG